MTQHELAVDSPSILPAVNLYAEIEELIRQIPWGRVSTVTQLALALGDASASRAVYEVVRDTSISKALPLHRVVTADGKSVAGYREDAQGLLGKEGLIFRDRRVRELEKVSFQDLQCTQPLARLRRLQAKVAKEAVQTCRLGPEVNEIGGVDVAYKGREAYSCCAVLNRELGLVKETRTHSLVEFPYVSTYLAFREGPSILSVLKALPQLPDIVLINGSGIEHPMGCGLATHVGVILDTPTIGVTTRLLSGSVQGPPEDGAAILQHGKKVGSVLQTATFRPIYVSPGHRVSVDSCHRIVKTFIGQHRLPEPIWQAHVRARSFLKGR